MNLKTISTLLIGTFFLSCSQEVDLKSQLSSSKKVCTGEGQADNDAHHKYTYTFTEPTDYTQPLKLAIYIHDSNKTVEIPLDPHRENGDDNNCISYGQNTDFILHRDSQDPVLIRPRAIPQLNSAIFLEPHECNAGNILFFDTKIANKWGIYHGDVNRRMGGFRVLVPNITCK